MRSWSLLPTLAMRTQTSASKCLKCTRLATLDSENASTRNVSSGKWVEGTLGKICNLSKDFIARTQRTSSPFAKIMCPWTRRELQMEDGLEQDCISLAM